MTHVIDLERERNYRRVVLACDELNTAVRHAAKLEAAWSRRAEWARREANQTIVLLFPSPDADCPSDTEPPEVA